MSKICVIVPVYKVEKYLFKCIDSILNQTFTDFELILVDDGSPDICPKICDEYAKKDSRIIVIHKENGGLSSARNAALDYMFNNLNCSFVTFIDSDDYVEESYLESLYNACILNDCSISCCGFTRDGKKNNSRRAANIEINIKYQIFKEYDDDFRNAYNSYNLACCKLFSKNIFKNMRFNQGRTNEDSFIIHRLMGQCDKFVFVDKNLYHYTIRQDSITGKIDSKQTSIDFIDIWTDRLKYYTFEHKNEKLAFDNFLKVWREIKHCLVHKYIDYDDYKGHILFIKQLYLSNFRKKQRYTFLNKFFIFHPRLYLFLARIFGGFKKL